MMLAWLAAFGVLWTLAIARAQQPEVSPPATTRAQHSASNDASPLEPGDGDVSQPPAPAAAASTDDLADVSARASKAPKSYGLWVLVPAGVAILLAILTRQVVPALFIGLLSGAYMMVPCLGASDPFAGQSGIVAGFRLAAERYVLESALGDGDRMKIIVFTLMIGFMVGVIGANGGTAGMVRVVAGRTGSRRRGALTAWLAGLVVFFDDYANTMIVGPTMRSVFDKLKLSRAKLAYIVDSTAAPVASIAIIGTWVGAEIDYIQTGLANFDATTAPSFLVNDTGAVVSGMEAFLRSIAYRFYPILALLLVFLIAVTGRDFGAMKKAESRALSRLDPPKPPPIPAADASNESTSPEPRWWLGLVPILILVATTFTVLIVSGYRAEDTITAMNRLTADGSPAWEAEPLWQRASVIIRNGDSYNSILYGAIVSAVVAVVMTLLSRTIALRRAADAGLDGMARMFPAVVILVLAWALSGVQGDLELGVVVTAKLQAIEFPAQWLPLSVFISAALISFATGSSWGTMGILCPVTVETAIRMLSPEAGLDAAGSQHVFYAAVGSVLAGAVFGDHCSPISDTTVLSSIACDCPHEEHVWTQVPYALVTAIAAMGLGDVLCSVFDQPWYLGLGAGAAFLVSFVFVVGRRAQPRFEHTAEDGRSTDHLTPA